MKICFLLAPLDSIFEPLFETTAHRPLGIPEIPKNPLQSALENLEKVIQTKGEIKYGLYRRGLGWVGFKWGIEGTAPPTNKAQLIQEWQKLTTKKEKNGYAFTRRQRN